MGMNVVVIGGSNIDVCAKSNAPLIKKDSNIGEIEFALGGVGRNIAEDLSLFGADTSLLTAVADDSFGHVVLDNAKQQNITLLAEPFTEGKTGVYAYISDNDGSFVLGVNDMGITEKITPSLIEKNINAIMFTDFVVLESNLTQETIEKICSYDLKLIADCVSSAKCHRLKNVISKLFLLKANKIEAFSLTGKDNIEDSVRELVKMGLNRGIITLGNEGAMCFENTEEGIKTYYIVNMPDERIVDTNGCGDAMLAGFTIALMRGKCIRDCLVAGQSAACLNARSFSSVNREMNYTELKETAGKFKNTTEIKEGLLK